MNIMVWVEHEKAFNPILGETYEGFIDGCPIYSEQISHHPPISAVYFQGRGYKISSTVAPFSKLGFNCGRLSLNGWYTFEFKNSNTIKFHPSHLLVEGMLFGDRTV